MITAVAVALVLATLYFILAIREKDLPQPLPVSPVQHLEDRKQAIYDNLRDLQFEYRLGKLSDSDYQQNKRALQRELTVVLAEMDETSKRLGLTLSHVAARPTPTKKSSPGFVCPSCGSRFSEALKFCGQCGKAMA